ncbi:hypothetical protein TNCV_3641731 [Trichonephila clavipes]|nr:hypothetical protein TNCV_3641731 [Trichonephila clavipes]
MSDIGPFPGYFLDDKQYHSRARSVGVYNPMTDWTYSHLRIVRMPSPVQSNCDAHDTIANGQYGAVWSMGHTQQSPEKGGILHERGRRVFEKCNITLESMKPFIGLSFRARGKEEQNSD